VKLLFHFWRSSIGKKWLVALSGLALIGFAIAHLAGNLQMFSGPQRINAYAEFLHANQGALWIARIGLLGAFALHIFATLSLVAANRAARPDRYQLPRHVQAKLSTRTMALSGLTVLSFVVFHLLHYTLRVTDSRFKPTSEGGLLESAGDVYRMVILGFQSPIVSGFYILSVGLLSLHLSHGIRSLFQTLGADSRKVSPAIEKMAWLVSAALFLGYASIPGAVLLGVIK
jgi:succinate dehydrogenase / fumarate reductase cytochrome b subunit